MDPQLPRGNYASRDMGGGSYDRSPSGSWRSGATTASSSSGTTSAPDRSPPSGSPLDRPDTEVVLGLLSSKTADLDDGERVRRLLGEAAGILPKERLHLSHHCGFASCDNGNELSAPQQCAKIAQGQRLAAEFWGE
ncbi:hypothetical protein [Microbacterium sp. NPDC096154]|uniref:hypothetical protein n=1 Tax=Microbacterium sp. NPDC096154 TaxID=3155549 RepID=UPI0033330056